MLDRFIELIQSPVKSAIAVFVGTMTGYVPKVNSIILNTSPTSIDKYFQYGVWILTSLVAVTALISWGQKQYDRYHKNNQKDERPEG